MVDQFADLAKSISDIVTSAIEGDCGKLASSIVDTVSDGVQLGSSAIESSSK
ncbi:beta-class phenol-soluble modulin [Corynebacterium bovis]|uniref:beta-class phenol-soluble modulin n=1 Tax=Corynebacterium bovis TaxID=36808 RepID=UPI003139A9BA